MATIRKRGNGWQAEVRKRGVYKAATFPTKALASAWAVKIEAELDTIRAGQIPRHTWAQACKRYREEVSPGKRGHVWEARRLEAMEASEMGKQWLESLDAAAWREWASNRLETVSAGTVLREMNLISHVYTMAVKEWRWSRDNPLRSVRRPPAPPARDRIPTQEELERLAIAFGDDASTQTGRAWLAFRFACETAMRAGEIVGLTWDRIRGNVAELEMTKNGSARRVPLSAAAVAILEKLPRDWDSVFGLSSPILDALWRKGRNRAGVEDLRFHDSRAYAVTMLARKVDILTLARISGHKNLKMLQVYYRETAEDIAGRL